MFLLFCRAVSFIDRARDNGVNAIAQRRKISLPQVLRFDHVMQVHGDGARPNQPACFFVEFKRADNADGNNGRTEMQRHTEHSVLERPDAAIPPSLSFAEPWGAYSGIERP